MSSIIQILPEVAVVVALVGAILFTGLAFRNPLRARWLQRDSASTGAALAISSAVCFGAGYMIAGSIAAGLGVAMAIGLTVAIFLGSGFAIWRIFEIGERLRRADAGQSPFYAQSGFGTLRHPFRRHAGV
jgi:drug/metabolite transporter (DMT)-like permease